MALFSEMMDEQCAKDDEIIRLRAALFQIQCEQLDRATDTEMSALRHRRKAMATRDRIITILNG